MMMYKLEKEVTLYKNQFEGFVLGIFNQHLMERLSMDLDGLLFRIKYMVRNERDLHLLPELKEKFITEALELRDVFGTILYNFLVDLEGDDFDKFDDVEDIMAADVKIDNVYVKFKMIVLSKSKEQLELIDERLPDEEIFNMKPDEFFRFFVDSYNDGVAKAYPEYFETVQQNKIGVGNDADVFCHNFTFQTSENCSLNCTYCYQFNKTKMRMSFDTAKTFIDKLLRDEYGYINRHNSPAIIIEFIGGEPLLEINLTRRIYEYFLEQAYELAHPWFQLHRVSICSNGLQYFDEEVQAFFKDYSGSISFNISIDGNKELHDSCRIQPNGEGSYDVDIAALNHFNKYHSPERNSKMTLAPENMEYLFDSVKSFIENKMMTINLNCIFEEGWNQETALLEYNQLKLLADYLLENNLEHLYISIFNERQEEMQDHTYDGNFCGGLGAMLSLRPNGQFYPCIRYMPTSVGNEVKDLCIGNIETGMIGREQNSPVLEMMDNITRRSQSNDICYDCPISSDCAWCSALGHTVHGNPGKKTQFICIQMIAEALANVYYWNLLNIKKPNFNLGVRKNNVPDQWALLVIDAEELDFLKKIEAYSMISTLENYKK